MKQPVAIILNSLHFLLISIIVSSAITFANARVFSDQIPTVELVVKLAKLSHQVYDVNAIDSENIPTDVYPEFFNITEHAEVLVGTFPLDVDGVARTHIFVAMRGTDEGKDWSVNGDFGMDLLGSTDEPVLGKSSRVRVHSGFNKAAFEVYDDVEVTLQRFLDHKSEASNDFDTMPPLVEVDGQPLIHFTGHSKGGAESQILATYLAHSWPNVNVQMVSFGAPQVGNVAFKRWAEGMPNLCSARFVLKDDLVPRLPPSWANYAKYGHLLQMQREGITAYWRQDGGGSYIGISSSWDFGMSISNHMMWRYVEFLEEVMLDPHIYYPNSFEGETAPSATYVKAQKKLELETRPEAELGRSVGNKCQKCTLWIFLCSPC